MGEEAGVTHEEIDEMAAGPEMDRLIAEKVMGWAPKHPLRPAPQFHRGTHVYQGPDCFVDSVGVEHTVGEPDLDGYVEFSPSTDLNAAVEACGKYAWTLRVFRDNYQAIISLSQLIASVGVCGYGPVPALALCRALLKATL